MPTVAEALRFMVDDANAADAGAEPLPAKAISWKSAPMPKAADRLDGSVGENQGAPCRAHQKKGPPGKPSGP